MQKLYYSYVPYSGLDDGKLKRPKFSVKKDFRSPLWFRMNMKDKILLYLGTNDSKDAELMILLIFNQYKFILSPSSSKKKVKIDILGKGILFFNPKLDVIPNKIRYHERDIETMKKLDSPLESTLKNLIYQKYLKLYHFHIDIS
jgi:hypothetical protein